MRLTISDYDTGAPSKERPRPHHEIVLRPHSLQASLKRYLGKHSGPFETHGKRWRLSLIQKHSKARYVLPLPPAQCLAPQWKHWPPKLHFIPPAESTGKTRK